MQNTVQNQSKGKTYATIVFLVILGIAVTVGSFALWNQTTKQTNFNALVTACLNLTIENESPEITMDYAYPVTDAEGLATEGYTFTVTNTCSQPVSYIIAVESVDDNSGKPFVGNQYIDISLDGKSGSPYSSLDTTTSDTNANYTIRETRVLSTKRVGGNSSRTHTVRMWLDENTPLTEQNKTFISKVKLTGGQGIEADCYTVNGNGTLIDYDPECGLAATIPATVNGHNVTRISSNAFKTSKPGYTYSDWDNTYSNRSSLEKDTCEMPSGSQTCKIDFSMVYSDKLEPMYTTGGEGMTEGEIAALLGSLTTDDVYVIIYNTDSSTPQYSHLDDAIDYYIENNIGQMSSLLNFDLDDIPRYTVGEDTLPNNGEVAYEQYIGVRYVTTSPQWRTKDLGYRMTDGTTVQKLAINSLDLSQATNLVRIDNRAFSNMPDLSSANALNNDICALEPGLTSLTFGTNKKEIRYGGSVFAGAHLNTLNLYNSMKIDISPLGGLASSSFLGDNNPYGDDISIVFGILPCSTINTLNIVRADNNYKFGGLYQVYSSNGVGYNDVTQGNNYTLSLSPISGFASTTTIGTLNIDNEIDELGDGAFAYANITTLNLPSSLYTLGSSAFAGFDGNALTLPSSLVTIGDSAFSSYRGTGHNLVIPASVRTIGEDAFWRYNGATLTFNEGLQTLGKTAFGAYQGADFTLPSTIRNLGEYVFNSFRTGTIYVNMTQADFQANVTGELQTGGPANNVVYLSN